MTAETVVDRNLERLILYLLEWLDARDRTYEEVMESWRTSCPHLPVWEEANQRRLVIRELSNGSEVVRLTTAGTAVLRKHRVINLARNYLNPDS